MSLIEVPFYNDFYSLISPENKDEIIEHCRKNLTAYKVPKLLEIVDEIPKSNVGKILRRELRENNQNA